MIIIILVRLDLIANDNLDDNDDENWVGYLWNAMMSIMIFYVMTGLGIIVVHIGF